MFLIGRLNIMNLFIDIKANLKSTHFKFALDNYSSVNCDLIYLLITLEKRMYQI